MDAFLRQLRGEAAGANPLAARDSDSSSDDEGTQPREPPPPIPGCDHDHSAEQRIFDLSPDENLACCALYKRMGNLYYQEGQYARAADRYARALVYDEYCFPKSDVGQAALERVRLTCLLNTAACDLKLERWADAVQHSTQALGIAPGDAKALFRRAVAHRHLGRFDEAAADIGAAVAAAPGDLALLREHAILSHRARGYGRRRARMLARMGAALVDGGGSSSGSGDGAARSAVAVPAAREGSGHEPAEEGAADADADDDAGSVASDTSFGSQGSALTASLPLDGEPGGAFDVEPEDEGQGGDGDEHGLTGGLTAAPRHAGGGVGRPWMVAAELLKL